MTDLKLFANTVKGYLIQAEPFSGKRRLTLEDLAIEVGFTREELSRKLNGKSNIHENDVRNIVRALSSFKAINSRGQAKYLLELMNVADFAPADWQADPLKGLAAETNTSPTVIPKVKELDDRDKEDRDVIEVLHTEEQGISPPTHSKQEQFGRSENTLEKALETSVQPQDGAYILGPVINQGGVYFFSSGVGGISAESGRKVTRTNPHSERGQLLRRLQRNYRSLLDQLHQGTVNIELGFTKLPDADWSGTASVVFHAECPMKEGTPIRDVYEEAVRELLLVGEAGAGKTTLLLTLGHYLIDQAEQDETCPIPVILSLSTWTVKSLALEDWISEQLDQKYHVRREQSKQWVQQKQILPLLDGLDEVEAEDRPACITAINRYYREHLMPLVVCSRRAAYRAAAVRERLYLHAVMVQSLTPQQVNEGLERAGEQFASLKEVFKERVALQNLVRVPLMLRFLLGIDPQIIVQELSQGGTDLEIQLKELYIKKLLNYQETVGASCIPSRYTTPQPKRGLIFLAKQMRTHKQAVFYLEHLQSNWLPTKPISNCYNQLAIRGVGILLGLLIGLSVNAVIFGGNLLSFDILYGLLGGLIGSLISGEETPGFRFAAIIGTLKSQWKSLVASGLRNGFFVGTLVCLAFFVWPSGGSHEELIYGCGMGACSFFLTLLVLAGKVTDPLNTPPPTLIRRLWNPIIPQEVKTDHCKLGILIGLIVGLSVGISVGLSAGVSNGYGTSVGLSAGFSNALSTGLTIGLSYTGIGILLCLPLLGEKSIIKVTDELEWTYTSFGHQLISKSHLIITLRLFLFTVCIFGLGVGIGIGLSTGWSAGISYGLKFGLSAGLSVGSAYWILFGLWTGVSSKTLNDDDRLIPNEGIRRSLHNALQIGLWGGALAILIGLSNEILYYGLYDGFSRGFHEGLLALLRDGIFIECFGALLPALLMGGITVLRHYLLRLLLWCAGVLPLHTIRFLEDATSRDLLHRDGGGYRFSHGDIFDYFADQKLL